MLAEALSLASDSLRLSEVLLLTDSDSETIESDALAEAETDPEAEADSLLLLEVFSERTADADAEADFAAEAEVLEDSAADALALLRDSLLRSDSLETAERDVLLLSDSLFLIAEVLSDNEVLSDSETECSEAEILSLTEADAALAELLTEASEALVLSDSFVLLEEEADWDAEVLRDAEMDPETVLREPFSLARDSEADNEEDAAANSEREAESLEASLSEEIDEL